MARDIARAFGHFTPRGGYLESERYVVSWAVGHLLSLAEPHVYDPRYRRWRLEDLPIVPQIFRLEVNRATAAQYRLLAGLLTSPRFSQVINACDAGREGEWIFRQIYAAAGCRHPVRRLWISSLTPAAIREGFARLRPAADFDRLGLAAQCRGEADWLVGLNATRALTKLGGELFSVGRVQTPTLAIVVRREREVEAFKAVAYWLVHAGFRPDGRRTTYEGRWVASAGQGLPDLDDPTRTGAAEELPPALGRLATAQAAEGLAAKVRGGHGRVVEARRQEYQQPPPRLFDLTELQREMNHRHGFSAQKTLTLAQELYETEKAITYPRTDSRYLTPDLAAGLPALLRALADTPWAAAAGAALALPKLNLGGRVVNPARVSDHHAIIPTPSVPGDLRGDRLKVYDAVVRRTVAAVLPPARLRVTTVLTEAAGEVFLSRGKSLLEPGWLEVEPPRRRPTGLPDLSPGQPVAVEAVRVEERETQPPPRYTDASLLHAMETAGRFLDQDDLPDAEDLRAVLKDEGLGTPATRAAIIERLIGVGYLRRERRALRPTPKGIGLVEGLPVPELTSPELTGRWEKRLRQVETGDLDPASLMGEIVEFTRRMVGELRRAPLSAALEPQPLGPCPRCGGQVLPEASGFRCRGAREDGCGFHLSRRVAGKLLDHEVVRTLLQRGRSPYLRGFRSQAGKAFGARLTLAEDGQIKFEFAGRPGRRRTR